MPANRPGPDPHPKQGWISALGPGLVTGASDDDPSGIGTYAQTGAALGLAPLWTCLLTLPLMIGIQEMCARIAMHTGAGLAQIIRKTYPRPVLYACVAMLVIANTVNIGADLAAMAASAQLLLPLPFGVWLASMAALIVALVVLLSYQRYARLLRYLALSLLAYVGVAFAAHADWREALLRTVVPHIRLDRESLLSLVAIFGTTISPYLFFWQASQEVEEMVEEGKTTPESRKGVTHRELTRRRADVVAGMTASNLVMWFIIVTAASTLHRSGVHEIGSAAQAAEALRPLAGKFASLLFAAGIVGTGLLAVPVLAGSSAYAIAESFHLRRGLYLKLRQAPGFYGVIALSVAVGAALNVAGINPMKALVLSAVLNGLLAPPLLFLIVRTGSNRAVMQDKVNGPVSKTLGWATTLLMAGAALALLLSMGH